MLFSQAQTVSGKITDVKTGNPLADVSARVKATKKAPLPTRTALSALPQPPMTYLK